ncbi:MAG: amidase domain-containing protein [Oscillospiraceae bacterium]|nr:amidase domain-containing protein [Oscillospiraceae bacterium]
MKFRIIALLTGAVAVALAVLLLIYFAPFDEVFDTVFQKPDEKAEPLSDVSVDCAWSGEDISAYVGVTPIMERYFDCFYSASGQKGFEGERILESLFADSTNDCVYDLAAMRSGAARLEGSGIDLSFDRVHIRLRVTNVVEINKDGVIIVVEQSAEPQYNVLKGVAAGEGIYLHTFIFERFSGLWMITAHGCDGGAWGYARRVMKLLCTGNEYPDYLQLYEKYPIFCSRIAANIKGTAALTAMEGYGPLPTAEIRYNRDAALEYARKWTSVNAEMRNTEVWYDYEDDSVNFVSQCIFAGIGKMDTTGSYLWKWFGPKIDYVHEEQGCSRSWSMGENFWQYCTENSRAGLCTVTDAAGGQMEIGDVVQLMFGSGVLAEVIVTDVVTDVRGRTVELLVSGHDDELVNYPLSAVHCDGVRFIKIIGYNDQ